MSLVPWFQLYYLFYMFLCVGQHFLYVMADYKKKHIAMYLVV